IDRSYESSRGYKVPEFSLFIRDYYESTIGHVGRFTVQCGEASTNDFIKLRLVRIPQLSSPSYGISISTQTLSIHCKKWSCNSIPNSTGANQRNPWPIFLD
ncbi:hypothetical protein CFOL_v3_13325, partial [Cephalotus follicularis]